MQQPLFVDEPTWSVVELSQAVGLAVGRAFPDEVWVSGEIANLQRPASGHVYFDLVGEGARLRVTLWAADRRVVNGILRRAGGAVRMADGTEVRLRSRVTWWPDGGQLSLRMLGIDTAYTLGQLEAERQRLLQVLEAEGLLARQRALALAAVPLRVGLVTSDGSAAASDFLHTLEASGHGWQVVVADTRVQGPAAEPSVLAALEAMAAVVPALDVVCLVRGGGARTDLAAFDREAVARAISLCPVPVLTGIGHEIDTTVADLVAHQRLKTPSACAAFLVERVAAFGELLDRRSDGVTAAAAAVLEQAGARLQRASARAGAAARHHLRAEEYRLGASAQRLAHRPHQLLDRAQRTLDTVDARARALDPSRLLARGWSITRDRAGRLVREPGAVPPGSTLVTTVAGGELRSTVDG
ncbi:MAG: exodeoxyribonuclease VII large subunit [Acidimicrobiia bacterium]